MSAGLIERESVDLIVNGGDRVTILRADGREASGKLAATSTDGVYRVATGQRGRPVTFRPEDLDSLTVHVPAS